VVNEILESFLGITHLLMFSFFPFFFLFFNSFIFDLELNPFHFTLSYSIALRSLKKHISKTQNFFFIDALVSLLFLFVVAHTLSQDSPRLLIEFCSLVISFRFLLSSFFSISLSSTISSKNLCTLTYTLTHPSPLPSSPISALPPFHPYPSTSPPSPSHPSTLTPHPSTPPSTLPPFHPYPSTLPTTSIPPLPHHLLTTPPPPSPNHPP